MFWLNRVNNISYFIHFAADDKILFCFIFCDQMLFHCVHRSHFTIRSSNDGHLACLHSLAIVNSAATNTEKISLWFVYFVLKIRVAEGDGQRERERETERDLPSAGVLPKWPQHPELGCSETGSQELLMSFSCGYKGSRPWGAISTAFSRYISRVLHWNRSNWDFNQHQYRCKELAYYATALAPQIPIWHHDFMSFCMCPMGNCWIKWQFSFYILEKCL